MTVYDFHRITDDLEIWDDWCAAWPSVAAEHETLGRQALATDRPLSAGQHLAQAALYYHFAKFLPPGPGPHPAVLMLSGLDSAKEEHRVVEQLFLERGPATFAVDARRIAHTLTMEGTATAITAPLLVVFGRKDRLILWRQAERLPAAAGGDSELLMLEEGNHGCANLAPWHRPYTADWLAQRLAKGESQ
ncbi:hypothetical protein SAMN05421869_101327 [Nonomuraea jiangxiensis]|uniref:Alpha/beta hydrolase n=1 Tax=Nonomuraea jiangxiensis TaxID=633440 RepID=A0A1G7Z712_9ACTN|nr:hypothetical protein SAMN05421869_101327 [Nonomuraea jiangxiensis]